MKLAELRTADGRTVALHPRLSVVEADAPARESVVAALSSALVDGGPSAGYVEVHGLLLDLDRATLRLLDVDPEMPFVLAAGDIPADAFGPAGRRRKAADDVAVKQRELVEARKQQAQGALEVVNALQAALKAASEDRDLAAANLADAMLVFDDAVASREAAERGVEAAADVPEEDETIQPEAVEVMAVEEPELVTEPDVTAEIVVPEPEEPEEDPDPWAGEREAKSDAVAAAEARVNAARAEVDQSARAANPARLSAEDRAELEVAHDAVLDADDKASKRFGGSSARRRLEEARGRERTVLDRVGLDSYSDFLLRSSMGATDPSAELRLEIARAELMEAEGALSTARAQRDSVPAPPPRRPKRVVEKRPEPRPEPKPEPVAAVAPTAAAPPAVRPPVTSDREARLAAAVRAREDAIVAEERARDGCELADMTLAHADAKLVELAVRHDEAEQTLAQARVRVDAALQAAIEANGHPSDPGWNDADEGGALQDEVDRHLLAWLAARGQHPLVDPLPILLDDVYRHVTGADLDALLRRLDRLADSLHVVYLTEDPKVLQWAVSLPPERAGVVLLPGAGRSRPA